jgi:hypothetical protein
MQDSRNLAAVPRDRQDALQVISSSSIQYRGKKIAGSTGKLAGHSPKIQVKCTKKPMSRGIRGSSEVKMGKLFQKILWTSQDRVMKGKRVLSNPIKEVHHDDTPHGVHIASTDSPVFGETL